MLKGADVVAYFTQQQYVQGSARSKSSRYEGVDFPLCQRRTTRPCSTRRPPEIPAAIRRLLRQRRGAYGIPWGGDADAWKMIDGKLYIFGGQGLDGRLR
jgi:hypothetical protein